MTETRNLWGLRFLSLALALTMWFFVSIGQREGLSVRIIDASVRYDSPRGFAILDPIEHVRVTLRGATSQMRILNPLNVEVYVRPPTAEKGTYQVALAPEDVQLPLDDVEVLSIDPNLITLELDRVVTRSLPVEARLEGEPAAGAVALPPQVEPGLALVRGPETRIRSIGSLFTSPINLVGHALDFEEQAAVLSSDPLVQVLQPVVVTVKVPMQIPGASEVDDGL